MKKILMMMVVALLLAPSLAGAQYYGYYPAYPWYATPPLNYQQYAGPRESPLRFYYGYVPPSRVYRDWKQYNRTLDQEALERSPLDREPTLLYMLRTF